MAARFEAMWAHKTASGMARAMVCRVLPCALAGCCLLFLAGCGANAGDADRATSASVADSSAVTSADDAEASAVDTIRQAAVAQNTAETERASAAIRQAIELVSAPYGETVSVTYLPVGSPAGIVSVNGATQHASASMIKLVVLAALLDKAAAGQIDLAAQVEVTSSDIVSGTGTVQDDGPGTYELRELARRMIADSDNTATNVIVDLIGMDAVNEEASKLGLTGTVMARKMMDMVAADQGMRNRMTSDDAATILNLIASGKLVNEQMSELAMSFLLQQTINAGLTDAIPVGVQVAHKTGELIQAEHDGGIVLAAHPYVLVVMTEGIENYLGVSVIADVSRAVYVATNGTEGVEQANATAQVVQDAINAAGGAQYAFDYDEPGVFFTPDYSYDGGADYGWSDEVPGGSGETGGATAPSEPTQPVLARKPEARPAVRRVAPCLSLAPAAPAAPRAARALARPVARARAPGRKVRAAPKKPVVPVGRAAPSRRTPARAIPAQPAEAKAVPGRPEGLPPTPPKASRFIERVSALRPTYSAMVNVSKTRPQ